MHLGMRGDLGGLPCQMAKLGKSKDTGRRKGGVVKADWGEIFGRNRCAKSLIPLRRSSCIGLKFGLANTLRVSFVRGKNINNSQNGRIRVLEKKNI